MLFFFCCFFFFVFFGGYGGGVEVLRLTSSASQFIRQWHPERQFTSKLNTHSLEPPPSGENEITRAVA